MWGKFPAVMTTHFVCRAFFSTVGIDRDRVAGGPFEIGVEVVRAWYRRLVSGILVSNTFFSSRVPRPTIQRGFLLCSNLGKGWERWGGWVGINEWECPQCRIVEMKRLFWTPIKDPEGGGLVSI